MTPLRPKLSPKEWHAALLASERLWPEPALSPEVPSRAELEKYLLHGPASFSPGWLREQIEESPACQRALEGLRLGHRLGLTAPGEAVMEKAGFRIGESPAIPPLPRLRDEGGPICVGDVRRSSERVFFFSDGSLRVRQTFRPLLVALVEGPLLETEQEFWRAVVCTPECSWPEDYFAEDELIVHSTSDYAYIAHLWLECPVAAAQLGRKIGRLAPVALEDLLLARAAYAEGVPLGPETWGDAPENAKQRRLVTGFRLDPREDAEALRERARLHDCATWLSATLDARIAQESWEAAGWSAAGTFASESSKVWALCSGAAAAGMGRESNACLEWPGPLNTLRALVDAAAPAGECRSFTAERILDPEPDSENDRLCRAQWSLPAESSRLAERPFAVFAPKAGRLLGRGIVLRQGEGLPLLAELDGALWDSFKDVPPNHFILLFPERW